MLVSEAPGSKAPDDAALRALAAALGERCRAAGLSVASAESCTGGWIAKCITDVAGSSNWFRGGIVAYADAVKTALLGVPAALIAEHGAVSRAVARAMAEGALAAAGAARAVAVTGVAGPDGGSPAKPVGTVWFAWAGRGMSTRELCRRFAGDREAVRRQTVALALTGLADGG